MSNNPWSVFFALWAFFILMVSIANRFYIGSAFALVLFIVAGWCFLNEEW